MACELARNHAGVYEEVNMSSMGGITGGQFYTIRGSQKVPISAAQAVAAYLSGHKQQAANSPLRVKIVLLKALNSGGVMHGCRTEYIQAALVLLKDEEFRLANLATIVDGLGGRESVIKIAFRVTDPRLRAICWRGVTAVERRWNENSGGDVAHVQKARADEIMDQLADEAKDQKANQLLTIIATIIKNEQDNSTSIKRLIAA